MIESHTVSLRIITSICKKNVSGFHSNLNLRLEGCTLVLLALVLYLRNVVNVGMTSIRDIYLGYQIIVSI